MVEPHVIEQRIREQLTGVTHVAVSDLTGTKDHFEATVVSSAFAAMSRIEQHQAVYKVLGELMAGAIHALALKTFTPERWENHPK